ncbi:MAG: fluoride efflux transporter CrcB [Acidimicrobiia bacterium]|nr:fluoride efflux transporter CrcB [Acidimicrobiia bacterium]
MSVAAWTAFAVAAAIGAPARYVIDGLVQDRTGGAFPWGTLVVNVSGCLLLGLLTGLGLHHGLDQNVRTAAGTGGLGAYTTFSTFTYETVRLAEDGAGAAALRNVLGNFLVGLAAAAVGLAAAAVL